MEHPDHSQNGQVTSNFLIRSFQRLLEAVASHAPPCQLRYTQSKALLVHSSPRVMPMLQDLLIWVWFSWGEGRTQTGAGSPAGSCEKQQKKTSNYKSSLQLCCFFGQEKGRQVLCLPAEAAGQVQVHDAHDLHHLRQRHLPSRGDQLPVVLGTFFEVRHGGTLPCAMTRRRGMDCGRLRWLPACCPPPCHCLHLHRAWLYFSFGSLHLFDNYGS